MPAYSGLYDGVYGKPYANLPLTVAIGNARTSGARVFARDNYGRAFWRGLLLSLNGVAPGAAALVQHKRVKWTPDRGATATGGGVVDIQTVDDINRVSAIADQTLITTMLTLASRPTTYPVDRSGNGGGSKRGF